MTDRAIMISAPGQADKLTQIKDSLEDDGFAILGGEGSVVGVARYVEAMSANMLWHECAPFVEKYQGVRFLLVDEVGKAVPLVPPYYREAADL